MTKHDTPAVRIAAVREGYRRCGIAHTSAEKEHPEGAFSADEIRIMRDDPNLVIINVGAPAPDPGLPTTPTVAAALEQAASALRNATPVQIRDFFKSIGDDPEISARIDAAMDRAAHLLIAIGKLEPGNPDHFTKDGKPRTDALEAALGGDEVSASDRDAAWEDFQEAKAKEDGE